MNKNDGMEALKEIVMIDNIISIVEKSRINKTAKYIIYDYLNNHIKKALDTPKISDSEVEELFMLLEEDYMRQTYDRFGVNETYQLKDDKDWSQLKTKFQQMQQEIDRLTKYAKGFVSISHHDYKLIQENEKKNQQYKQLLDNTRLEENNIYAYYRHLSNVIGFNSNTQAILVRLENIALRYHYRIMELKSIGGQNEKKGEKS